MAGLKLVYNPENGHTDFEACRGNILFDDGLRSAVMISLGTDARARDDDDIPDGTDDPRGWWGDELLGNVNDRIGSRRWLLSREKQLDDPLRRLEDYDTEALQWLIDDGVASRVQVVAEHDGPTRYKETIRIWRTEDDSNPWEFVWDFELGGRQTCTQKFEQPPTVIVALPLDETTFEYKDSTAYSDTVMIGQGDDLLRPIINQGSTAYNETIAVAQGVALLRPILNQGSTAYNETIAVAQGAALLRPILNQGATTYNEAIAIAQGVALLRPIINQGSAAYNETIPVAQGDALLRPIINNGSTAYNDTTVVP